MPDGLRAARVRVPGSTSNLGTGYDTIGLALDRFLDVEYEPGEEPLIVERTGTLARLDEEGGPDLVADTFTRMLELDDAPPTGRLRLSSGIPVGRGLGSSAAAVIAGFDLARVVQGLPRDDDGAYVAALTTEGHGDNAAPCLYGGLRAVVSGLDGPSVIELELSADVGFAYAAPSAEVSTAMARQVLPKHVPHAMAAKALGRLTALITGLATADPELIRLGIEDELHVPHRLPMIPGAYNVIGAGYDAGAWAVTISGAGSGLIAMCDPDAADDVAAAMRAVFCDGSGDPECVGFAVKPDFEGLRRALA